MSTPTPRLHVLLASQAPLGLVIRRGPAKRVATVLWDRSRDEFRLGQWLKGRIYERRSDLSPDGRFAIYFAMNGKWHTEARGAWTAISRAPHLKAIVLLAKGDCWHGGGLWTGPTTYWLNDGHGHDILQEDSEVQRDRRYAPAADVGGECPGVYYQRLRRDGWRSVPIPERGPKSVHQVFEKDVGGGWTLRKTAHASADHPPGTGCYWDEHELVGAGGQRVECAGWEWADHDRGRERLVWAAHGRLHAGKVGEAGVIDVVDLHDFRGMTFEAREAPY